jgi:hypothetical protein
MWAAVSSFVAVALPRASANRAPPRLRPAVAAAALLRWRCTAAAAAPAAPLPGEPAPPPKRRYKLDDEALALLKEKRKEHGRRMGLANAAKGIGLTAIVRRACLARCCRGIGRRCRMAAVLLPPAPPLPPTVALLHTLISSMPPAIPPRCCRLPSSYSLSLAARSRASSIAG